MSQSKQFFVDYIVLTPFGKLSRQAGPFNTQAEADACIRDLQSTFKVSLLEAKARDS